MIATIQGTLFTRALHTTACIYIYIYTKLLYINKSYILYPLFNTHIYPHNNLNIPEKTRPHYIYSRRRQLQTSQIVVYTQSLLYILKAYWPVDRIEIGKESSLLRH